MARNRYKLPTTTKPVKALLLPVFVPDDPAYLAAFKGALGSLAYASNWAMDQQNTRFAVAEHWLATYLESAELWTELEHDLSPLTVNVNCCNCAGSSGLITLNLDVNVHIGADDLAEIIALPGGNIDNGYSPPIEGQTYQQYLELKCAYANQLATDIYNSWDNLASLGLSAAAMSFPAFSAMLASGAFASSLVGIVGGIVTTATVATAALGAILGIGTIFGLGAYVYFEQMQQQMSIAELRCALYGATDAEDARQRVQGQFYEWAVNAGLNDLAMGTVGDALVHLAMVTTPVTILEPLFDQTGYAQALPVADCSLCSGVTPPPEIGLVESLISYWEMEESGLTSRLDSHGSNHLGTNVSLPANLSGITGSAVELGKGTGQRLQRDAPGSILDWAVTHDRAISGWFYIDQAPDSGQQYTVVSRWRGFAPYGQIIFYLANSRVPVLQTQNSAGVVNSSGVSAIPINTWTMFTVQNEPSAGYLRLYLNDNADPTCQIAHNGQFTGYGVSMAATIGGNPFLSNAWTFDGRLDELSLWNRSLTQPEREWLYNAGQGVSYANLVAAGQPV